MSKMTDSRFEVKPSISDHFSWMRTQMSLQRTLMSATRTAVSLIGFGFTVAQFFEHLRDKLPQGLRDVRPDVPRNLGLLLIAAGVVSLAVFTLQFKLANDYLRRDDFAPIAVARPMHVPAYLTAFTVLLIGIAAFVSVLLRF
jgi:putative membrane protein